MEPTNTPRVVALHGYEQQVKLASAKEMRRHPTEAEAMLWSILRTYRASGLKFRRQHVFHGFILDFYCHAANLGIEVDGEIHEQQRGYDNERDALLKQHGITVVRFSNAAVMFNTQSVVAQIHEIAEQRALLLQRGIRRSY